jgi:hypothetical protein
MDRKKIIQIVLIVGAVGIFLCMIAVVGVWYFWPESIQPISAQLNEVFGVVQVRVDADTAVIDGYDGMALNVGGQVNTGNESRTRVDLSTGTIVRVGPNTVFTLNALEHTDDGPLVRLRIAAGQVWVILNGGVLEADTPSGVASVRGSYVSVYVDPITNSVFVTCLEGDCALRTNAGVLNLVGGQTAEVTNINEFPVLGVMEDWMVEEWLIFNPETIAIIPALTATARASLPDVPLPGLACLSDNTCETYCRPEGWDPNSGTLPTLDMLPADCVQAGNDLLLQGVDPYVFFGCILFGGEAQFCANTAVRE